MFKKILFLAISLFCVTSCFAFSKAIKLGEPYNGAVKDSIFVDDAYGNKYIVVDRKSTRLNSSHTDSSRMPSSA